jgi:hypothetical protein
MSFKYFRKTAENDILTGITDIWAAKMIMALFF